MLVYILSMVLIQAGGNSDAGTPIMVFENEAMCLTMANDKMIVSQKLQLMIDQSPQLKAKDTKITFSCTARDLVKE